MNSTYAFNSSNIIVRDTIQTYQQAIFEAWTSCGFVSKGRLSTFSRTFTETSTKKPTIMRRLESLVMPKSLDAAGVAIMLRGTLECGSMGAAGMGRWGLGCVSRPRGAGLGGDDSLDGCWWLALGSSWLGAPGSGRTA